MVRILEEKKPTVASAKPCMGGCCSMEEMKEMEEMHEAMESDEIPTKAILCPRCSTPVTEYDVAMIVDRSGSFGKLGYNDMTDEVVMAVYKCPECGQVISDDEDDAKSYLEN